MREIVLANRTGIFPFTYIVSITKWRSNGSPEVILVNCIFCLLHANGLLSLTEIDYICMGVIMALSETCLSRK